MSTSAARVADLTQGDIPRQLLAMAIPIAIGMVFQTLYFLVDLYFVGRLGDVAIAGVSAAGNVTFVIIGLTQALGVGTVALIAQATGRRDHADANLVFNQSLSMSAVLGLATLAGGYLLAPAYMRTLAADRDTAAAGLEYLTWYLPGLGLQFALVAMGSALRGTGIVKPTMVVQMLTVVLNAALAPVLIAGWGTGRPLGVAGAGLASTLAIAAGVLVLGRTFHRLEHVVKVDPRLLRVRVDQWARILRIGVPAGGEFLLLFTYMAVIYTVIRGFGHEAQAAFGVGNRVMQAMFLPVLALAFAATPVAAQNFGAGHHERVRATFRAAALFSSVVMFALTLLCQWRPDWFIALFTNEPQVIVLGAQFLTIISWNYVTSGLISTCSGMFQAMGNTLPALMSSASRLATFVIPAFWLSHWPRFELRHLWLLSVATVTGQAVLSLLLLRREFQAKLAR